MISTIMSFAALFSAALLFILGNGVLNTQLSVSMTIAGFSSVTTGKVMACYFIGIFSGYFFCSRVIGRVGHIRAFAAFAAASTTTTMLYALYDSPLFWAMLRFTNGVAVFGLFMVIESWLNECSDISNRGRIFSVYMTLTYMGLGVSQQLLNIGNAGDKNLFLVAAILTSMSLVPVALTRSIHPKLPEPGRYNFKSLFQRAPIGMLGCILAGLANSAFLGIAPVFGLKIGLTVFQVSWLMSVTVFGGLAVQWFLGIASDRFGRTRLLFIVASMMAIVGFVIMADSSVDFYVFLFEMGILGGLMFAVYPLAVARTHDVFEAKGAVAVSSALLLCYSIGAIFGPVLASFSMTLMQTPYGLFAFLAIVNMLFAVSIISLIYRERIKIIPLDQQVEFIPMENTSQVAVVLDPRADLPNKDSKS